MPPVSEKKHRLSLATVRQYSFAVSCGIASLTAIGIISVALLMTENRMNTSAASSGTNFRTTTETFNCGDAPMSGGSFRMTGSVCEPSESASGTTFAMQAGTLALDDTSFISIAVSSHIINFGVLTTGSVSTDTTTATVGTNAPFGYVAQIYTDGTFRNIHNDTINPVTDGTVTAGSEEYGIRTSGTDGQFNSTDQGISTTPVTFASSTTASNNATIITFKAAISGITPAGTYHQIAYLIATGRF